MRILIIIALAFAVVALICAAVPMTILGMPPIGWVAAALVAFFVDCQWPVTLK